MSDDKKFGSWTEDLDRKSEIVDDDEYEVIEVDSPKKKSWFSGWLPKRDRSRGALSDYWNRRSWSGGGTSSWRGKSSASSSDKLKFVETLRSVSRTGRIVNPHTQFGWTKNSRRVNAVALDSEPLTAKGGDLKSWTDGHRIDAVMGRALSTGARKRRRLPKGYTVANASEVSVRTSGKFAEKQLKDPAALLGDAFEWLNAVSRIKDDFPGYGGYFDTERSFYQREWKRDEIQTKLQTELLGSESGRTLNSVSTAVAWNMLRPETPIRLSEDVDSFVDALCETYAPKLLDPKMSVADFTKTHEDALAEIVEFCEPDENCENEDDEEGEGSGSGGMSAEMGISEDEVDELDVDTVDDINKLVESELDKTDMDSTMMSEAKIFDGEPGYISLISIKAESDANIKAKFNDDLAVVRPLIARTREALAFRHEDTLEDEYGLRRGSVDEGKLAELVGGNIHVFRRQDVISAPKVSVGFLVDESGSMNSYVERGADGVCKTRVDVAREAAILLVEACDGLKGVSTAVWGHSCNEYDLNNEGVTLRRYLEPGMRDKSLLGGIEARANNADGYALAWAGKRLLEISDPASSKILFVLSDGQPAAHTSRTKTKDGDPTDYNEMVGGTSYGGPPAWDHVKRIKRHLDNHGVQVIQIAIGKRGEAANNEMYGSDWTYIENTAALPAALGKMLERVLRTGSY